MENKINLCVTIDTEGDAASNPNSTYIGTRSAIPKMVETFDKLGIKATFFVQEDRICQVGSRFADIWKSLEEKGHEIGYHAHGIIRSSPEEQEEIIAQGLTKLRELGLDPVSYRGGRFFLNGHILKALEKNGIKYDSSVVPGLREVFRDGRERCNHIGAPTDPYFPSFEDHTKRGDSKILELPINRYPKFPSKKWGGVLNGGHKDEILFDYFLASQKYKVLIMLLHSWAYLSYKIRDAVRRDKYGKFKKLAYESLTMIFKDDFLTNGEQMRQFERVLHYITENEIVNFSTIREVGESWVEENR